MTGRWSAIVRAISHTLAKTLLDRDAEPRKGRGGAVAPLRGKALTDKVMTQRDRLISAQERRLREDRLDWAERIRRAGWAP